MSLLGDLLRNNAASGAGRTVGALAFGNPAGIEPPLPAAEREAQAIAQIYPDSRAFVGAEASEWRVRLQAQYGRIVHFATHGILRSDDPNESYIALASGEGEDGKLTQGEIFGLPLEGTRLVVLSACQTGLGEREPGREVSSLAQAFAIAGAPTILASLWAVNDESTAELMEAFYRALLAGQTKAQALQTAQRVLLAREKYHHPYHWAAFVLLGAWE
jgi:CHAT domain-containing protein